MRSGSSTIQVSFVYIYINDGVTRCKSRKTSEDVVVVVQRDGLGENIWTEKKKEKKEKHGEDCMGSNKRVWKQDTSGYRQHLDR